MQVPWDLMVLKKQNGKRVNGKSERGENFISYIKNDLKVLRYRESASGGCNPNRHILLDSGSSKNISPQLWIKQIHRLFLGWH